MKTIIKDSKVLRKAISEKSEQVQTEANSLLDKIIFMEAELEKLQAEIQEKGWIEEYKNGANQYGMKKSASADVYNTLIKNYLSALDKLNNLLVSASKAEKATDPLLKALGGN